MLEARGIDASDGRLAAEVKGGVGKEEGVLVVRRIHVKYQLRAAAADEEAINRAFDLHPMRCPVYRTLHKCIDITTELAIL
ncbi:MAG: OsmC family protein [Gemmatimonadota bacterium]|nr:OsmC family protein [Gemmatimonadota bacterium]MDE2678137.1 OsmC family protein [Gemmatimonadota bacterium]MYA10962.1 OsmC family protein [Gemmatimonadota bacterium]MYE71222.1 OsmC family protein [Gemmatimonadota bacterium]